MMLTVLSFDCNFVQLVDKIKKLVFLKDFLRSFQYLLGSHKANLIGRFHIQIHHIASCLLFYRPLGYAFTACVRAWSCHKCDSLVLMHTHKTCWSNDPQSLYVTH